MTHEHAWIADRARSRFVCATCRVVGHKPSMIPGQHRTATTGVIAYRCQRKVDGGHCGAEATHATGDRQASRCAEHATATIATVAHVERP